MEKYYNIYDDEYDEKKKTETETTTEMPMKKRRKRWLKWHFYAVYVSVALLRAINPSILNQC